MPAYLNMYISTCLRLWPRCTKYIDVSERFLYCIRTPTQNQLTQVTCPVQRPPLAHCVQATVYVASYIGELSQIGCRRLDICDASPFPRTCPKYYYPPTTPLALATPNRLG